MKRSLLLGILGAVLLLFFVMPPGTILAEERTYASGDRCEEASKRKKEIVSGTDIVIQLNDKIMPIDRGEIYEDPLEKFLRSNNYGEIDGSGTKLMQSGEIEFCDIKILIYEGNDIKKIIDELVVKLEALGAPKGSYITIEKTQEQIPFGTKEGLAIYLDGVNLPDDVYKECDVNVVLSELARLVGYSGKVQRYWQGNTETALYFYGDSFEEMKSAILEYVNTYPLCKGARISQIA